MFGGAQAWACGPTDWLAGLYCTGRELPGTYTFVLRHHPCYRSPLNLPHRQVTLPQGCHLDGFVLFLIFKDDDKTAVHRHRNVFHATRGDSEFTLEFFATRETANDVELFHSVLVGYAADVHGGTGAGAKAVAGARPVDDGHEEEEDLSGRFVLVNEDSGEIVGALDRSVRVHEGPSLGERGHENDPVVVELPEGEGGGGALDELRDIKVIVRAIPPEERDWMLKSVEFVRCVFSSFSLPHSCSALANK